MKPNLKALTDTQKRLWPELAETPQHFTLYGGVAIALRFNHRQSADFDFFSSQNFDPQELYRKVPYLKNAQVLQMQEGTLTCSVDRDGPVKLSFFGLPTLGEVEPPEMLSDIKIKVASLIDLAGTKASTIQRRAASRDYLDLDVLISEGNVELESALVAARQLYGSMFNPQITIKALTYYGDGDLKRVSSAVQARLIEAVHRVDSRRLAARLARLS